MNRLEAITRLREDLVTQHPYTPERTSKAKELGIEALEYFHKLCQSLPAFRDVMLPSETKE